MMLELARSLCTELTGSRCNMPRLSNWALVSPSQSSMSIDIADVVTGGVGAVVPANVKAYGSYFESGLEYRSAQGGLSSQLRGFGMGAGLGAGWGVPFVGTKLVGRAPREFKRYVLKKIGESAQGKIEEIAADVLLHGASGGTRLISGPDAKGELTTDDIHNSVATITSFGANFVINGISFGMILIAKNKPILCIEDLIHVRAIGLIGGVGLATSLDIEVSNMVYRIVF